MCIKWLPNQIDHNKVKWIPYCCSSTAQCQLSTINALQTDVLQLHAILKKCTECPQTDLEHYEVKRTPCIFCTYVKIQKSKFKQRKKQSGDMMDSYITTKFDVSSFNGVFEMRFTGDDRRVGGGWIRLIVGFQPLMVISPTASWIRWCMQVYACEFLCNGEAITKNINIPQQYTWNIITDHWCVTSQHIPLRPWTKTAIVGSNHLYLIIETGLLC